MKSYRTVALLGCLLALPGAASAQSAKPNILVIFGDDVGQANISAYSHGVMGYTTPNIDRLAREGCCSPTTTPSSRARPDAPRSSPAGHAAHGLSKGRHARRSVGLQARDVDQAQLLKALGYATGQFGKNHLGDRNEYLPTVHGFDEFFGNLYHLNAEEDPRTGSIRRTRRSGRHRSSRRAPQPGRGQGRYDRSAAWGKVGRQTIEDTGPLTKKRMETIDDETSAAAIDFMKRQHARASRFYVWMNSTRMHFRRTCAPSTGQAGPDSRTEYADGMIEHDAMVGAMLKASTISASPTTRSSSTPPTTDRTRTRGRMPARRRSAARRTRTGKAPSACRPRSAGPATSSPARSPTTSSARSTGCLLCWPRPATRT
jgi:arylsulfatase